VSSELLAGSDGQRGLREREGKVGMGNVRKQEGELKESKGDGKRQRGGKERNLTLYNFANLSQQHHQTTQNLELTKIHLQEPYISSASIIVIFHLHGRPER